MTVIETKNYIIFSGDELEVNIKKEWVWNISAYDETVRRENTTGDPRNHYREVQLPLSNFIEKKDYDNIINQFRFAYGREITIEEIKEEICYNWSHVMGGRTNRWGEEKVVKEAAANDFVGWKLWLDDEKIYKDDRKGAKDDYKMKLALKGLVDKLTIEVDGDTVEDIGFYRDVLPNDLHLQPNLYIAIAKEYIKKTYGDFTNLVGVMKTRETDENGVTKEVIFVKNSLQETQQAIRDGGGIPQQPQQPQQGLEKIKTSAKQKISQVLIHSPEILNEELEENNKSWKDLIEKSDKIEEVDNIRERVLADIQGKRKQKITGEKLSAFVQKGQGTEDYEELKKIVEQIEKFRGEENYKLLESEINAIKEKLAQKDPNKYRDNIFKMIEEEMKVKDVEKDELDLTVKKELEKLENGEITDPAEIDAAKNKISNNIGQINAKKKLQKLIREFQKSPNETTKKKLLDFIGNKNNFYENAYQNRKSEINKMLGISSSYQPNSSKNDFPLVPVMIIGSLLSLLVCLVIIVRQRRIRQRKNKL